MVLCAGAPDTPEIMAEVEGLVDELRASRTGVVWIAEMLPRPDVVALLTDATAFACPSIYEPLGIVNLEAMACETAVVATATGGIPEVVVHGETGRLVPIVQATDGTGTPLDPDHYVADFAEALIARRLRPGPRRRDGPRRPGARDRGVLLGRDRRADRRGLPFRAVNKNMFLLWGDDLPAQLHDPALHAELATVGVRRLQLNIDDEPVAAAMRIPQFEQPVGAIVSVWDVEPGPVADVLASSRRPCTATRSTSGADWTRPRPGTAAAPTRSPTSRSCAAPPSSSAGSGCAAGWSSTPRSRSGPRPRSATCRTS